MASRLVSRRFLSTTARRFQEHEKQELKKESKRNPETLVRHNTRTLFTLAGRTQRSSLQHNRSATLTILYGF